MGRPAGERRPVGIATDLLNRIFRGVYPRADTQPTLPMNHLGDVPNSKPQRARSHTKACISRVIRYAKNLQNRVSISRYPVRLVNGAAPRNRRLAVEAFCAQRGPGSYIKVAALIYGVRTTLILNTQGEDYALHDDHVSEGLRKSEVRLGTRL